MFINIPIYTITNIPPSSSILVRRKFNKMPANVADVEALARNEFGIICERGASKGNHNG